MLIVAFINNIGSNQEKGCMKKKIDQSSITYQFIIKSYKSNKGVKYETN